jgi:hypothetical protein
MLGTSNLQCLSEASFSRLYSDISVSLLSPKGGPLKTGSSFTEKMATDKHSSLFERGISDEEEGFTTLTLGTKHGHGSLCPGKGFVKG